MGNKKLTVIDSSISFILGFLISQISVVFFTALFLLILKPANLPFENLSEFAKTAVGYLIMISALDLGLFAVAMFYKKKSNTKLFNKLTIKKVLIYILIAVISYFVLLPIVNCVDFGLIKLGVKPSYLPYELTTKNYFISLVSLVLLPAICEEFLFRGIIFNGLKEKNCLFAILLSSLMFAIFHTSVNQLFYPFVMGILISSVMAKEDNLFYPILIHSINNFLSLTLSYLNIELFSATVLYLILAIALFVAFIVFMCFFIKKIYNSDKQKLCDSTKISKKGKIYSIISLALMSILWIIINIYS